MDWKDVVRQVNEDRIGKEDVSSKQRDLYMLGGDGSLVFRKGNGETEIKRGMMSEWSSRQLYEKLGIPVPYARRMPSDILAMNVNYWLTAEPDKEIMLRYRDDNIRGVLSGRYQPYDNYPVIEAVDKCLEGAAVHVDSFHLDDLGFHLKMTSPELETRVGNLLDGSADIITSGFYVTNSEVGARAVRIGYYIKRLICSNGLIGTRAKDFFYQRHMGLSQIQFEVGVAEGIGKALKASNETVTALVEARARKVESPAEIIKRIVQSNRLSQQFQDEVMIAYGTEQALSGDNDFSVIQAFTRAAHGLEVNKRVEVETLAGYMLDHSLLAASRNYVSELVENAVA